MGNSLNKKGSLDILVPGIMVLVFGAIMLIFGLMVLDDIWDITIDDTGSILNETLIMATVDVGVNIGNFSLCGFRGMQITVATYDVNETRVEVGNYTIDSNGTITPITGFVAPGQGINFTGTYTYGASQACAVGNETIFAQGKFADYFDLIVLAVIIVIILSLIVAAFGLKRLE